MEFNKTLANDIFGGKSSKRHVASLYQQYERNKELFSVMSL